MKPSQENKNIFASSFPEDFSPPSSLSVPLLHRLLVYIDILLSEQVNSILHHPKFQKLEATWRNLLYLSQQRLPNDNVKVRVLDITWSELSYDLQNAIEFDHSQLFNKIYTKEFDQPGGEPFGLLICDHYVRLKLKPGERSLSDIQTLFSLSGVAAAAFAPCIIGVAPEFFGLDKFSDFDHILDLNKVFKQIDYALWKKLRNHVDARFIGLVLPRVNVRLPYHLGDKKNGPFCFKEECTKAEDYLWGNPVYALAAVVIRSFAQTGWFLDIKGTNQDSVEEGGVIEGLPTHYYTADASPLYPKPSIEISLKAGQETELTNQGFIPVSWRQYTPFCAFYSCQTIYLPGHDLSSEQRMKVIDAYYALYNILSVSRFAHYLKVIGRNKVGSFISASQYQSFLQGWISQYTADPAGEITQDFIAKYPLAESAIVFQELQNQLGYFFCTVDIRPHIFVKGLAGTLKLSITLPGIKT